MTLRIAHVNVARGYRGGERQTELLARALAKENVEQVLVVRKGEPLAERMGGAGIEVRPVSGHLLGVTRALSGVDVVHVHEGRSVYAAHLRSLLSGTPYLITRRVNNPLGQHRLARRAWAGAGCVVAVAADIEAIVQRYNPRIPTEVIHSSSSGLVAQPQVVRSLRESMGDRFVVGHVGALDNQQKGQEYIIQVARELQDSHPDVHFVLVGGGDDEAWLKESARDLNNLDFIGFVDNVGDYLAAFDLFILPSNKEGIGAILLDAMGFGLPVIASRVGGLPEIVRDDENGYLIDPAQPDQLKRAILLLRGDPERRHRLGQAGRRFASAFTAEAMAERYLALYRSLAGSPQ